MSKENNWIVLINKVPRGPLSEDELRSLLNLGVVRLNDVAYQVDPANPKSTSDWRFLWQFEQFDRRRPADGVCSPVERRTNIDETKLRKKISENIPHELQNILPEELILRGQHQDTRQPIDFMEQVNALKTVSPAKRFTLVGIMMFFVFLGTYGLYTGKAIHDNLTPAQSTPPKVALPNVSIRAPAARMATKEAPIPKPVAKPIQPVKAVEPPAAKDPGEITADESKRLDEDRVEKLRQQKEDADRYAEDDENEEDPPPKAKKKKKREVSQDEELDEALEENDEEFIE